MTYCIHCMEPLESGAKFCPTCGKAQSYDCPENFLRPGTRLHSDRYLIGAAIGEGGFGITYMARDLLLDMTVAVKEFYPDGYVNRNNAATCNITATVRSREFFEKGKEKFLAEARILASLHDAAGIVDVRDFFEENNTTYIVMEFLRGETLKDHLKKVGKMPYDQVCRLLLPAMQSLVIVHEKGVIHRDISPDNIMLTQSGVKLLDFGAAREAFSDDERSYSVMLKRGYSPVEQYTKKNQGPWTDVYALCATMYRCITGVVPTEPFLREQEPLRRPSELGVAISPQFEAALMNGLGMYPEQRYQTMDALIAAFDAALRGEEPQRTVVTVVQTRTRTEPLNQTVPLARGVSGVRRTQSPPKPVPPKMPPVQPPMQPMYPPVGAPADQTVAVRNNDALKKKGGAGKWIAIVTAVLVIIGGAVFAVWWMQNREANEAEEATKSAIPIVIDTGEQSPRTTESTVPSVSMDAPASMPETVASGYPSTAAIGKSGTYKGLAELLDADWPGTKHQLSYDENTGSLSVWLVLPEGTYVGLQNHAESTLQLWDENVAYCKSLSVRLKDNFATEGIYNVNCAVGLLNDTDLDSYLFKCIDGKVVHDVIDG